MNGKLSGLSFCPFLSFPGSFSLFYYKGIPYFIVVNFTVLHRYYGFYNLKVCGNPEISKSIGAIFPIAFVYFMTCWLVLVIFAIFLTFSLLLFVMVIHDQ